MILLLQNDQEAFIDKLEIVIAVVLEKSNTRGRAAVGKCSTFYAELYLSFLSHHPGTD